MIAENIEFCSSKQNNSNETDLEQNDGDGFMNIPDDVEAGLPFPI